ncbi:MAG: VOC family protein [Nitrospirota bacterium]|nr:VOC family protein [Nitrospirota bacterium]
MEQRLSLITLGVEDLRRSRSFYEQGLGWRPSPASNREIVVFQLGGIALALYPRTDLARDANLTLGEGFGGMALAHNVRNKGEVDKVLAKAKSASAKILRPAGDTFWGGYSGCFADLDGHPWEVAWNPHWPLDEDGAIQLPA